ncbi:MAG: hypothetical protein JRJ87_13565 [Deltaproteobacteria bacterium]|nr:hypothetical protein [Deltaproteobacteria bacterium]
MKMILFSVLFCPLLMGLFGCGGSGSEAKCQDVVCNVPPADECKDSTTLLVYESTGTCNPDTGECEYDPTEQNCEHGCGAGRCLDEDKCLSVVCDDPLDNACKPGDDNTLLVYEAIGDCNPDTGECEYDFSERHCDNGCENGICADQDLCLGVVCDDPPDNACKPGDDNTLLVYEAIGDCNPDSGRCEYDPTERLCENGCTQGRCLDDKYAVGFVTVLEHTSPYGAWAEVRAYFAVELHHRKIPSHKDITLMTETAREGSCVYYGSWSLKMDMCDPPCEGDQYCAGIVCKDYPAHWDVGTISVAGLKLQLSVDPDSYDNYRADGLPEDLFDGGIDVVASAGGGDLGPFSLGAKGVAPLEIDSSVVDLIAGKPTTVSWTPADPDTQVQVFLRTGIHWPSLPSAAIVCEAPDGDGEVVIPASMVDAFRSTAGPNQQLCEMIRFTRDVKSPFGGEIELTVGSVQMLQLNTP